jgi:aromatic amino acid aminotransferase I
VSWKKHPGFAKGQSHADIEEAIFKASVDRGSLLSRGSWFRADHSIPEDKMFFRATYAAAPGDKLDEAITRCSEALRAEFSL